MKNSTHWMLGMLAPIAAVLSIAIGEHALAATADKDPWSTDGGVSVFYSWTELPKTPGKMLKDAAPAASMTMLASQLAIRLRANSG